MERTAEMGSISHKNSNKQYWRERFFSQCICYDWGLQISNFVTTKMVNPIETRRRTVPHVSFPHGKKRTSRFYCSLALESETPNLQLWNLWLGRMYDKRGNYGVPWWTNRSVEQYKARSECMVNQYSDFSYFGKHVSTNTSHLLIKTRDKPKP